MSSITKSNITQGRRVAAAAILAVSFALIAQPASAGDDGAVAIDDRIIEHEVIRQISANEARRTAYRHLAALGYSRKIGPGSARVRSITRDGGTWIVRVAISNGTSVQSEQRMLYIDARTALVSEIPPEDLPSLAAQ